MLDRITLHTMEDKTQERHHLYDGSCQSEELLSYNHMTDIGVYMNQERLANDIMNWPFFLAFVAIDNDEDEDGDERIIE